MKSFWIPDSFHSGPLASLTLGQICLASSLLLIYFGYNSIVMRVNQVGDWVERRVKVLLYTKDLIANGRMASIHPC